jgi:hypothetical protein
VAEIFVFELVAVRLEGDVFGAVDEAVNHGGAHVVEEFAPPTEEPEVRI